MTALDNYKIYWIHHVNHTDPKIQGYVGITKKSIEQRFRQHKNNSNTHLNRALQKYGDEIVVTLLGEFDKDLCRLLEEEYRPLDAIGWNITKGGGIPPSSKGKKKSKESIEKAVASRRRNNKPNPLKGRPGKSGMEGKKHTEETKKKMKKPKPEGFGAIISHKMKNYQRTKEHCENIAAGLRGKKLTPNQIAKREATKKERYALGLYNIGASRLGKKRGPYKKKVQQHECS